MKFQMYIRRVSTQVDIEASKPNFAGQVGMEFMKRHRDLLNAGWHLYFFSPADFKTLAEEELCLVAAGSWERMAHQIAKLIHDGPPAICENGCPVHCSDVCFCGTQHS